jgi:hypothetical protein
MMILRGSAVADPTEDSAFVTVGGFIIRNLPYWPPLSLTDGHSDPTTDAIGPKEETCADLQSFMGPLLLNDSRKFKDFVKAT